MGVLVRRFARLLIPLALLLSAASVPAALYLPKESLVFAPGNFEVTSDEQ